MTIKHRAIKGSSIWPAEDVEHFYTRQEVKSKQQKVNDEARVYAAKLWKLLVDKMGVRLAKDTMYEIMGDKKPGPRRTDERKVLIDFIRRQIQSCDSNQSDEQIAKRILDSEPHYLHEKCTIDDLRDWFKIDNLPDWFKIDDIPDWSTIDVVTKKSMDLTLAKNPKARVWPVGKGLAALEKQVGRIRREMIEEGSLPKAYAPKPYHRD